MARKPKFEGGTKEKILECATSLFFEKGYDGTSIRSIVDMTGCEIGVFYYYYESKDAIFNDVVEHFFEKYEKIRQAIVEQSKTNPVGGVGRMFVVLAKESAKFKEEYGNKLHNSMRIYINEMALLKMEPCMVQVLNNLIADGAKPIMSAEDTAKFLTHTIGSLIVKTDTKWLDANTEAIKLTLNHIMGVSIEEAKVINDLVENEFLEL